MPLPTDRVFILTTRYNAKTFLQVHHETRVEECETVLPELLSDRSERISHSASIRASRGVLSSAPGQIEVYLVAGRYLYKEFNKNREWVDTDGPWVERLKTVAESTVGDLLERILDLQFGE